MPPVGFEGVLVADEHADLLARHQGRLEGPPGGPGSGSIVRTVSDRTPSLRVITTARRPIRYTRLPSRRARPLTVASRDGAGPLDRTRLFPHCMPLPVAAPERAEAQNVPLPANRRPPVQCAGRPRSAARRAPPQPKGRYQRRSARPCLAWGGISATDRSGSARGRTPRPGGCSPRSHRGPGSRRTR